MFIKNLARPDPNIVFKARIAAAKMTYDGRPSPAAMRHINRCTHHHKPTQTTILYTRDVGMHDSGWWKNPDYNRCLHLSLSFIVMEGGSFHRLPHDHKMSRLWAEAFFGDDAKLLWIEGPFSEKGKIADVWHYRLFCDPAWKPILPRGEVYSRDWTPSDWKSWSDIHGVDNGDGAFGARLDKSA